MKLIHISPRATEKAYRLVTALNTYVFNVPLNANKDEIAKAVEAQFDGTKVSKVKSLVQSGKAIRFSRGKRKNPGTTHRSDTKKAYVTLSEGSIRVFDEVEQEEGAK